VNKLKEIYKKLLNEVNIIQSKNISHGLEHTQRVFKMCKILGEQLDVDMDVLLSAAILHDVSREQSNHAFIGSMKAKEILKKYDFDEDQIERIAQVINTHSFSSGNSPNSLEGKILSDADKLDALGSVGIYRAATYSQEYGRSIDDFIKHFYDKLLNLDKLLYTEQAKKIGKKRKDIMMQFLEQIKEELN